MYDLIIIGGGCTGYSAAMYAGRLKMKTLVLEGQRGGVLAVAGNVENYPGFESIDGFELVEKMRKHATNYEIEIKEEYARNVEKKAKSFTIKTDSNEYETKTIIFATGSQWKKLNVPGEKELANKGVHYCALCDGPLYKGKTVAVIGGSDSAAKDSLVLTEYAKKVYIIYRKEKIRPEPVNLKRVEQKQKEGKIEIINNTNIKEIQGTKKAEKVILDKEWKGSKELALDAIFIAIGHNPLSELAVKIGVKTNDKKEIIIDREAKTNIPGVYAAGDVVDTVFKQAITGTGEAVLAAYSAYTHLSKQEVMPA